MSELINKETVVALSPIFSDCDQMSVTATSFKKSRVDLSLVGFISGGIQLSQGLKLITQEGLPCVGTDPSSLGARTDVLKALAPGGKVLSYWPSPYFPSN